MKRIAYILCLPLLLAFAFSCTETSEIGTETAGGLGRFDGAEGYSSSAGGGTGGAAAHPGGGNNQPGVITAGEWNDLDHWDFWQSLLEKDSGAVVRKQWGFFPEKRYSFIVKDASGAAVPDCRVALRSGDVIWENRTDNFGKAELWAGLFGDTPAHVTATVELQGQSFDFNGIHSFEQGVNALTLPVAATPRIAVDVMLVVDATGSMGDELEYFKVELNDVLSRAGQTPGIVLRTGSVFYRDEGDEYVTRISPLTADISKTVSFVQVQFAGGGGDWPEAVHTALRDAIEQQQWSSGARARLLFLLLDAPPHDNEAVRASMRTYAKLAAQKGIKIIPITASGIDKNTEFLMRFLSVSTNGTYVFITNHSGIGGEHIEATVGEYEVEFLNNLMVRLIRKYSEE